MTQKDYEKIAECIRIELDLIGEPTNDTYRSAKISVETVAFRMAAMLLEDNPERFSTGRFLQACSILTKPNTEKVGR